MNLLTIDTITDEQTAVLAKVAAAASFRAGGPKLTSQLAKLTYHAKTTNERIRVALHELTCAGLVYWDNVTKLTATGEALLAEILAAGAGKEKTK